MTQIKDKRHICLNLLINSQESVEVEGFPE